MGMKLLKPQQQHLLHQVVNKFHGKGRTINGMGGKIGEIADNHKLVKSYIEALRKNNSMASAQMFEDELEKPMGLLAKFEQKRRGI